jgi:hypothetical protein
MAEAPVRQPTFLEFFPLTLYAAVSSTGLRSFPGKTEKNRPAIIPFSAWSRFYPESWVSGSAPLRVR